MHPLATTEEHVNFSYCRIPVLQSACAPVHTPCKDTDFWTVVMGWACGKNGGDNTYICVGELSWEIASYINDYKITTLTSNEFMKEMIRA
jgi:hypothetical protein